MQLVEPLVAIIADIDKVHVRSPGKYGYNNGFALSVVDDVASEKPCGVVKSVGEVRVLIRSTIMAKFK